MRVVESAGPFLILFDGECLFCIRSVQFIIRRDPKRRFKFGSVQASADRLASCGFADKIPDSVVLIANNQCWVRSTAVLEIVRRLQWPWPLLYAFVILPRFLRDWLYDVFAKRRRRWFGTSDSCQMPAVDQQDRFIQ